MRATVQTTLSSCICQEQELDGIILSYLDDANNYFI